MRMLREAGLRLKAPNSPSPISRCHASLRCLVFGEIRAADDMREEFVGERTKI